MFKTTVYLERADLEVLQRLAREQRESSAQLIRRAIRVLGEKEQPRDVPSFIGCVDSGGLNLSGRVDEMLGEWARAENTRRMHRRRRR